MSNIYIYKWNGIHLYWRICLFQQKANDDYDYDAVDDGDLMKNETQDRKIHRSEWKIISSFLLQVRHILRTIFIGHITLMSSPNKAL